MSHHHQSSPKNQTALIETAQEWMEVFVNGSGECPVEEFFKGLEKHVVEALKEAMKQLRRCLLQEERNKHLAKQLDGKVWELRDELFSNPYRLAYFTFPGRLIVYVLWFHKKDEQTPPRIINLAQQRRRKFIQDRLALRKSGLVKIKPR